MTTAQFQASDPAYSVWVAASAGTGKTTVLTSRVLRLLLNGTDPGKILCLTYTNAGAAEMESRIKAKLCRWVILPENELIYELINLTSIKPCTKTINRARQLFLKTLDAPDGIKIQTIHSFCQGLMRRFPLEAGIVPHFKVVDDKTAKELLKEARVRLFADKNSYSPEIIIAIDNILWRIREGTFSDITSSIINDRGRLASAIAYSGGIEGLKRAIFKLLDVEYGVTDTEILRCGISEKNFDRSGLHSVAIQLLKEKGKSFVEIGNRICKWLEQNEECRFNNFDDYADIFLTQSGECRKSLAPKNSLIPTEPLYFEQERIYRLLKNIKKARLAVLSASMVDIASSMLELYGQEKSGRAYLDYNDLIVEAERLLTVTDIAPWVLYKLDGGIDHLLLDEAQDTSPQQWRIIDAICAEFFSGNSAREVERSIFVVGDEKQSIFSFQGAAPEIFSRMQNKFQQMVEGAGRKWLNIRLDESFRSAPAVLDAVNKVRLELLTNSFLPENGGELQTINEQRSFHKKMYGKVEVWPIIEPKDSDGGGSKIGWVMPLEYKERQDPKRVLAEKIADEIAGWINSGRIIKAEGRAVCAGDIMILLRKRADMADNIIASLKRRNIPVAGHDRLVITEHIAVMDLMALGNFLLLPDDSLSLACVLKSPLIGLLEEDLFKISYNRGGNNLWQSLCSSEYKIAVEYLSNLLSRVDYLGPFNLYSYILEAQGGRKNLVRRLGYEINDPVDEFLSLALEYEKSHISSLQGFLRWISSGKSEIKRDMEQGNSGMVRVMTVHGSKGLEAPIVIMPDTTTIPDIKDMKIFWHESENNNVFLWPGGSINEEELCKLIKQNQRKKQEEEYYRLLYVAMTRAKTELYISGFVGKKERQEGCWYNVIHKALSPYVKEDGVLRLEYGDSKPLEFIEKQLVEGGFLLPQCLFSPPMAEPNPTKPLTPSRIEEERGVGNASLGNREIVLEGKIIHSMLELLPDFPEEEWLEVGRAFLGKEFASKKVLSDRIDVILQNVIGVMQNPVLKDLFGRNSRAEVPVVGMVGGEVISGRIDRLVVLEDKVIIADYKTGRIPPVSKEKISKPYLRQMQAYQNIIQEIFPEKTVECYLLWTEGCVVFNVSGVIVSEAAAGV